MKHVVSFKDFQVQKLLAGELQFDVRFYKKRPEFLNRLNISDIIFFRKYRKEVVGQFQVRKLVIIESLDTEDGKVLKSLGIEENFENQLKENSVMVVIQIENLEQLITSPIDVPKSRKEWIVLEDQ